MSSEDQSKPGSIVIIEYLLDRISDVLDKIDSQSNDKPRIPPSGEGDKGVRPNHVDQLSNQLQNIEKQLTEIKEALDDSGDD